MAKAVSRAYSGTYGYPMVKRMDGLDFKVKYRTESKKVAEREAEHFRSLWMQSTDSHPSRKQEKIACLCSLWKNAGQ